MIPQPSIVATDDNEQHLGAIVKCIQQMGAACLPILFEDGKLKVPRALTAVRLLFFDLHYVPGTPAGPALYDVAAGVLEKVIGQGNGPYVLITWSSHESEHDKFLQHVLNNFENIPPPATSAFLDKGPFIAGGNPDAEISGDQLKALADRVRNIVDTIPQVSAMMHWEDAGRAAAGDVITSLINLVPREECFLGRSGDELERLLLTIARAAVGKENVEGDRIFAINEGLAPILLDRLIHTTEARKKEALDIWGEALSDLNRSVKLRPEQTASLNARNLISSRDLIGVVPGDRGAVSTLCDQLDGDGFQEAFGVEKRELFGKYIDLKEQEGNKQALREEFLSTAHWRLVGSRAACDQAQQRGVTLKRVCLALEVPGRFLEAFNQKDHGAAFYSPLFMLNDEVVTLIFNWHYAVALTAAHLNSSQVAYRLREPLISQVTTCLHIHGLRPGIISYR